MKHMLLHAVVASGVAFVPLIAMGQTVNPPNANQEVVNPYYSTDEYQLAHSMFNKVRADLYRAQTNAYPNYLGDRSRFDIARNQLNGLEGNWDQGKYDVDEFQDTLSAVQMVLNDNHLMPHDRDVLSADVSRLLDFRTEYY